MGGSIILLVRSKLGVKYGLYAFDKISLDENVVGLGSYYLKDLGGQNGEGIVGWSAIVTVERCIPLKK